MQHSSSSGCCTVIITSTTDSKIAFPQGNRWGKLQFTQLNTHNLQQARQKWFDFALLKWKKQSILMPLLEQILQINLQNINIYCRKFPFKNWITESSAWGHNKINKYMALPIPQGSDRINPSEHFRQISAFIYFSPSVQVSHSHSQKTQKYVLNRLIMSLAKIPNEIVP